MVNLISPCVTLTMNDMLLAPYCMEEVRTTMFSMKADKSPGLDGFNLGFYQNHWHLIGEDVSRVCTQYLAEDSFSAKLNETGLVLIPKKPV